MGWAEDIWNSAKQKVSNVTEKIGNAIDDGISFVKDNASAVVHTALDVAGFIPVVGTAADVANAAIYAAEGDWKNAGLSALSAIPGIGDGIAAVSKSTKVVKAAKTVSKIGKAANEAVGVLGSLKNAAEGDFTGVITDLLFAGKGKIKSKLLDKFRSSRLGKKLLPYLDKAKGWLQETKGKIKTGANKVKERVKQLGKKVGSLKDKLKQKVADLKERLKNFGKKIKCKLLKNGKCFTGDTLVYTKEGYLPIKNIRAGDDIYSREERTGETGFQKVEEVFLRSVHTIYTIEVNTTAKIQTTSGHPFYVEGEGWVIANQLQVGMNLQTINGTAVITDLRKERTEEEIPVYNFRVSGWSSYFVSEWNVYVHNGEGYNGGSEALEGLGKLNKEIEIIDSKGKCLGEFDEIDLQNKIFYEDKTAKGLNVINPRTGLPSQTPQQFADKQIYTKTKNRINNLAISTGTREAKTNIVDNVPDISELQSIKKFVFRLDGDSPDLISAVQDSIKKLELEFPDYTFEATFGNH